MYASLDILDVDKNLIQANIIDIRDKFQYYLGHIPNSTNIPYIYLIMAPDNYLNKNEKYYFYCEHGEKSRKICMHLQELGYQVVDLVGGYEEYEKNISK